MSVRPSVTRVLYDKMNELTADILIQHEIVMILALRHQRMFVGDVPFHLKFAVKVTQSL